MHAHSVIGRNSSNQKYSQLRKCQLTWKFKFFWYEQTDKSPAAASSFPRERDINWCTADYFSRSNHEWKQCLCCAFVQWMLCFWTVLKLNKKNKNTLTHTHTQGHIHTPYSPKKYRDSWNIVLASNCPEPWHIVSGFWQHNRVVCQSILPRIQVSLQKPWVEVLQKMGRHD